MHKKWTAWLAAIMLIAGIGVICYPTVSNLMNRRYGSYAIQTLREQVGSLESEEIRKKLAEARVYNQKLLENLGLPEALDYERILDFGNGIMGYILIPQIGVELPIYHGVDPAVLEKGIGHMPETAFPIGGAGNHTVLTGHTGLPSAKLFTDLMDLKVGDRFQVVIGDQSSLFQVDQIRTVLPTETDELQPIPGGDYCTLVTCTPYGVNSHRLLVRGTRIEPDSIIVPEENTVRPEENVKFLWMYSLWAVPVAAGICFAGMRRRT